MKGLVRTIRLGVWGYVLLKATEALRDSAVLTHERWSTERAEQADRERVADFHAHGIGGPFEFLEIDEATEGTTAQRLRQHFENREKYGPCTETRWCIKGNGHEGVCLQ